MKGTYPTHPPCLDGLIVFVYVLAVMTPVVTNYLDKRGVFVKYPWSAAPVQVMLCGVFLTFATPMACALFSQRAQISTAKLEPELQVTSAHTYVQGRDHVCTALMTTHWWYQSESMPKLCKIYSLFPVNKKCCLILGYWKVLNYFLSWLHPIWENVSYSWDFRIHSYSLSSNKSAYLKRQRK